VWRIYHVQVCYETRWLTGLWSTGAKVESIMPMTAWYWGRHTRSHPIVCRYSVYVGLMDGDLMFFPQKGAFLQNAWVSLDGDLMFIHKKAALLLNGEKLKVTVQRDPRRRKAYIQWGAKCFPKGSLRSLLYLH
jgi:hypothetical protein